MAASSPTPVPRWCASTTTLPLAATAGRKPPPATYLTLPPHVGGEVPPATLWYHRSPSPPWCTSISRLPTAALACCGLRSTTTAVRAAASVTASATPAAVLP